LVLVAGAAGVVIVRGISGPRPGSALADSRTGAAHHGRTHAPAPSKPCTVSSLLVPSCGAWWGMFLRANSGSGWVRQVGGEEQHLGRRLDIVEQYYDMSTTSSGIFPNPAAKQLARHHLILFNWTPDVWSRGTHYTWSTIASGALDSSVIVPTAQRMLHFHHTVFLTPLAEPDGAPGRQGTPSQYVAAYRHIHDVFTRLGVHNVVWVWTTEGFLPHASKIQSEYPGNAYVDWIGYDPYNFFDCHASLWQSFARTVEPYYHWLLTQPYGGKPIMLPEYGSAPDPRSPQREASWFASIPATLKQLPRLKALVEWNASVPGICNLKLGTDPAAQAAFRQAGLSPYFQHTSLTPTVPAPAATPTQGGP
jgi:hypothetical protein